MRLFAAVVSGLGLCLLGVAWVADRALVGESEALQANGALRLDQDARIAADAVAVALDRLERRVVEGDSGHGAEVDRLALPPPASVPASGSRPYGRRSREELVGLLASSGITANGFPEAVIARLALGPAAPVSGSAAVAVEERLLTGALPVRPDDLPFLAERLGIGADPRVPGLQARLREIGAASRPPRAPVFDRSSGSGSVFGRTLTGGRVLLRYAMAVDRLLERVPLERGVLEPVTTPDRGLFRVVEVPGVAGLRLRFRPAPVATLPLAGLRVVLWLSTGLGLVAVAALARLRRRERRAHARERAFLAGVTHELRSPLAALRALGETLAERRGDPVEYGALVAGEAERLERLAEQALTLARLDEAPRFAVTDPVALLRSAVDVVGARARRHAARIDLSVEGEPGPCRWDADAVRRALLNLIDNAFVHGGRGGRVAARLRAEPHRVRLSVQDDGPGVGHADRRRIFERFQRGRGEAPGTGLGLYLVERVARSHGGWVELDTAEGRGATFTLVLPADPPSGTAPP